MNAVNTSGRAVLFAGIIVCIALLGMFALGVSFLYGLAIAAAIGVLFTMIAALTLLPALLGFIGPRVLSRQAEEGAWPPTGPGWSAPAPRASGPSGRPSSSGGRSSPPWCALVVVVLVALPFFSLRLGSSDQGNDPVGHHHPPGLRPAGRRVRARLQRPAAAGGTRTRARPTQPDPRQAGRRGGDASPAWPSVVPPVVLPDQGRQAGGPDHRLPDHVAPGGATTDLIDHLRQSTIPAVVAGTGVTVYVGGNTAIFVDFAQVLSSKLPLFIGLVVVLSFLLLAIVFRSLVIPLTAAVMNLLSIGAAFGVLVAVFQWGWLGSVFQVGRTGPIEAFLPVMLFAILFGLSMDYEVFLITRIQEEYAQVRRQPHRGPQRPGRHRQDHHRGRPDHDPGVRRRSSSAASGSSRSSASAWPAGILIDAVLIRMAIVPSLMFLFGKANWWFPAVARPDPAPTSIVDPELPRRPPTRDRDRRPGGAEPVPV